MPDQKRPKKISAKAVMRDLKADMADTELMEKYGLSFQGLQDLFAKLVKAGLATESYFTKRAMKFRGQPSSGPDENNHTCPYCGYSSAEDFTQCPRCNQDTSEWLDTVELTKILSFD